MRRDSGQVPGAYPGRQQGLVSVAKGGLGDCDSALIAQPTGELRRSDLEQELPGPSGRRHARRQMRQLVGGVGGRGGVAIGLVHGHVGQICEQLCAPIGGRAGREQMWMLIDEGRRQEPGTEIRIVQHRLQERDVGGYAADPELRNSPAGSIDRRPEIAAAAGELGQHGVEMDADLGAGVCRTSVEAHPGAARRAVRRDLAGVGTEVVRRVLGRDAALQSGSDHLDAVLGDAQVGQRLAGGNPKLGLHEVDRGHLLGDRVLDLDPRVHLDEEMSAVPVDQELHRPRIGVTDGFCERDGVGADRVP